MTKKNSLFHSYMENLMVKVGAQLERVGADLALREPERQPFGETDDSTQDRTGGQTLERTGGQTGEQTVGQVNRQLDRHLDRQVNGQLDGQLNELKNDHLTGHISDHLTGQPPPSSTSLQQRPFAWLTPNQEKVLRFLIHNQGQVLRLQDIEKYADVPYGSVRRVLRYLKSEGYIIHLQRVIKGRQRGLSYRLNQALSAQFIASLETGHLSGRQYGQACGHLSGRTLERTVERTVPLSSSSFLNKTTTTKSDNFEQGKSSVDDIAEVLASHPELGYWRQKNLTPQQIQKWMEITGASLESIIQSLCHCRFEMVELDMEKQKDIQNVFNWFYRIIERAGFYPRPKEYKSYLERQLEIEKKLLAEKQERLKSLAELQQQKKETERSLAFYEMLAQPDSELYQACYSRLDKFTQNTKNTSLFERFMRDAFDQIMDEREQRLLAAAKLDGEGGTTRQRGPQSCQNGPRRGDRTSR